MHYSQGGRASLTFGEVIKINRLTEDWTIDNVAAFLLAEGAIVGKAEINAIETLGVLPSPTLTKKLARLFDCNEQKFLSAVAWEKIERYQDKINKKYGGKS